VSVVAYLNPAVETFASATRLKAYLTARSTLTTRRRNGGCGSRPASTVGITRQHAPGGHGDRRTGPLGSARAGTVRRKDRGTANGSLSLRR